MAKNGNGTSVKNLSIKLVEVYVSAIKKLTCGDASD